MNRLTGKTTNLEELLEQIKRTPELMGQVKLWHVIPEKPAQYADFPSSLHSLLTDALKQKGIRQLFTHQAEAFESIIQRNHVVTVTPTASGKTLCYNLPVLQGILENDSARALYLFPTKALAQDQLAELHEMVEQMEVDIKTYTYDGDTPPTARQAIRSAGHIVVTNPDMLHAAILPHHTKWIKLFENLKYVVIDEVHSYRGVFGSHVANVIRRLKRICRFYGSSPQFICASATIANPQEHAEKFIGERVVLVDNNGAPSGEKHFIFYNPPVVNQQLGIRRSSVLETQKIAGLLLKNGIQTIVFARSRVRVEILLNYLQERIKHELGSKTIRGYRGGYLPKLRREIERGLRNGEIRGVVSTNALPFEEGETFGDELFADVLEFLVEERTLHKVDNRWYWMEQSFPAHNISLRSAAQENFVIIDRTEGSRVIGEVDRFSAPTLIHEEAIYLHEGVQFQVEELDYEEKKAYVRRVSVDYFTDANLAVQLKVLHKDKEVVSASHRHFYGEVTVNAKATIFKKIKLRTHENIGSGPIHLPEEELHTSAYWFSFSEEHFQGNREELQLALLGLANVMVHIAPIYLMCDPYDIRVVPQVKEVHEKRPTIFFYDRYPGGIGLSQRLFEVHAELLQQAKDMLSTCGCLSGCPACVGPIEEVGLTGKEGALKLLNALLEEGLA